MNAWAFERKRADEGEVGDVRLLQLQVPYSSSAGGVRTRYRELRCR